MYDVTFGRNGRDGERWRLHSATAINDVAIPGRSLMSMHECLLLMYLLPKNNKHQMPRFKRTLTDIETTTIMIIILITIT